MAVQVEGIILDRTKRPRTSKSRGIDEVGFFDESPRTVRSDFGSNNAATLHNSQVSVTLASAQTPLDTSQTEDQCQIADSVASVDVPADGTVAKDLWSAAYHEAILSLGKEVNSVLLKGERIGVLLASLEETNEELAGESLFRRGVQRLHGPLKNFKFALDLASPLASFHPVAISAVSVVSGVTALAIAICGADESLNAQIISMLEHVEVIDECDTMGQKLDVGNAIHKALVPVYKDLLNFYLAAADILSSKMLALALVRSHLNERLPSIVTGFLGHAALLKSRIDNATFELVAEIKNLLQENKIQKLLGANTDKQRSQIHCEKRELRANEACEWIVADPRFVHWYNAPDSEQLVLFGDMGCGKSVVTAHVIEELIHQKNHQIPRPLICYHYCKDDETGRIVYIYSSLILQLLDQQEGFKVEFLKWYDDTRRAERLDPAQSSTDLGNFFATCVETLDRPLFVVIDGLDECERESRRTLLTLLDSLSQKIPKLKVYFSSRPQEGIESALQRVTPIRWVPTRERDAIIASHAVKRHLGDFPPAIQSLVTDKLSELAQGSALWVRLTIELIQTQGIRAVGPMKAFLANMPPPARLSELYAELFKQTTGNDPENEQLATVALEILAIARRPLSIYELGWAVALSDPGQEMRTVDELGEWVDERRVLGLLQPFLSLVDFQDAKRPQLRLLHQSLKELILADPPSTWAQLSNTATPALASKQRRLQRQPKLDGQLLHVCIKYLLFETSDQHDLFSEEQETAQTLAQLPGFGSFEDSDDDDQPPDSTSGQAAPTKDETQEMYYDPSDRGFGEFFVYASCFWTDHFAVVTPDAMPDISDLVTLCSAKSTRLHNWVGQHCRPDCTIQPKFVYDGDSLDALSVTSLYGSEVALKKLLNDQNIGGKDFLVDSARQAIQQIVRWGDVSRLQILFRDPGVGPQVRSLGFFRAIMSKWCESERDPEAWAPVFDLVLDIVDDLVRDAWGNELLCVAANVGCLPMVQRLFKAAANNPALKTELLRDVQRDCNSPGYYQSVGEAVWGDHVEVLRYLLQQDGIEAHLRHRDSYGNNVFHQARRMCNPAVVTLLIQHFHEGADEMNHAHDTPLNEVVFQSRSTAGRLETARILLTLGGANARGGYRDNHGCVLEPLCRAAGFGDAALCRLLVDVGGVDPRLGLRFDREGRASLRNPVNCPDPVARERMTSEVLQTLCSLASIQQ